MRIERVQAEVFAILRAQHYGQKIDSKDILAWSGPEVESTMEERSTSGYRAFDLSCKGSYGTTKFLKIVPSKHLDWGEF